MQMLPGTDFIFSGYSSVPNYDNMFAGANFDAEDFDDYNILQRDLMVDGRVATCARGRCNSGADKSCKSGAGSVSVNWASPPVTDTHVQQAVYAARRHDVTEKRVLWVI